MDLTEVLRKYGEQLARQWAVRLHEEVSNRYSSRPLEELLATTSKSTDANYDALVHQDYTKIDAFIADISKMRLEGGFSLSEVQKAFEIYRTILIPILVRELQGDALLLALEKLNACLSRTIFTFSDRACNYEQQQQLAISAGEGGGAGYWPIIATLTELRTITDECEIPEGHEPPFSRRLSVTYSWDASANAYVADSDSFERLAQQSRERF